MATVTHKPTSATAFQFDGTTASLDTMLAGLTNGAATVAYQPGGAVKASANVSWTGGQATLNKGDWLVIPADGTGATVLPDAQYQANWQ